MSDGRVAGFLVRYWTRPPGDPDKTAQDLEDSLNEMLEAGFVLLEIIPISGRDGDCMMIYRRP